MESAAKKSTKSSTKPKKFVKNSGKNNTENIVIEEKTIEKTIGKKGKTPGKSKLKLNEPTYYPNSIKTALSYVTTDWKKVIEKVNKNTIPDIDKFLEDEARDCFCFNDDEYSFATVKIYPPVNYIFNSFNHFNKKDLKVVIIGQDPYVNEVNGVPQAMGMSFSVLEGVPKPPSLKNIHKEMVTDLGITVPKHGNLTYLAKQGILWINAAFTVRAKKSNSHAAIWKNFTDNIIKYISTKSHPVVFILWGGFAQGKEKYIDTDKHRVIKGAHPSPLSSSKFWGCKHFSKTNEALKSLGMEPIKWEEQTNDE